MTIQLFFQVLKYAPLHLHEVLAFLGELMCKYVRAWEQTGQWWRYKLQNINLKNKIGKWGQRRWRLKLVPCVSLAVLQLSSGIKWNTGFNRHVSDLKFPQQELLWHTWGGTTLPPVSIFLPAEWWGERTWEPVSKVQDHGFTISCQCKHQLWTSIIHPQGYLHQKKRL